MRLLNYRYIDTQSLKEFVAKNELSSSKAVFIQLFAHKKSKDELLFVRDELKKLLPNASIMVSSTAGNIENQTLQRGSILCSFSLFDTTECKVAGFCGKSASEITAELKNIIKANTKLLVILANPFRFNAEELLCDIGENFKDLAVVGGNSADDFEFKEAVVVTESEDDADVAIALLSSDTLDARVFSLFNYKSVGKEMTVSMADGNKLFEIDGKKAIDVYREYLGDEIADNILEFGMQFPLLFKSGNMTIARAPIAVDKEFGSLTLAGDVKAGETVRFGYMNLQEALDRGKKQIIEEFNFKREALYIYNCAARLAAFDDYFEEELFNLHHIADASGFVTYGEFFGNNESKKLLLNITLTFVALSETKPTIPLQKPEYKSQKNKNSIRYAALSHLISKTARELDENLYYLEQFKKGINDASIISTTDERGIITFANENFEKISGYSKEELIGKSHNIIRHPDMPKELFQELWQTIKSGKTFNGIVKNRRKDGSAYHVITEIFPIYNKDGSLREYVGVREDITELEEYKELIKSRLDTTSHLLREELNYKLQYDEALDEAIAIVKTDKEGTITYTNEFFRTLSGYEESELIGRNCRDLRAKFEQKNKRCIDINKRVLDGEVVKEEMTNIAKDGKEFVVKNIFYPINDINGEVVEILQIMQDITEIVELNKEITKTQEEIVLTLGEVSEVRSKETGLHVKRVAEYSYLLAQLYGLSDDLCALIKQASPMHDIGKIGIADSVLNKPGKLTEEEFEIIKTHAALGYEMFKNSDRPILKTSAIIAYTHHEKYAGGGYPRGLEGEDIPIEGRITALADVFDALGHDRCYKKAWPLQQIFELFRSERGKHFDPVLIDLFFENLDKFLELKNRYEDEL